MPNRCLQPPLPTGVPPNIEVGTDVWMLLSPVIKSRKTRIVWLDMEQHRIDDDSSEGANKKNVPSQHKGSADNWWPGMGKWRLGMSCEDAVLELGHPELLKSDHGS